MKKIITAIGDEYINKELKKEENLKIILNDIQYREGIIEVLEEFQDINFIILNTLLQGDIEIKELIKQINIINKNIKIIIISENNGNLEELINEKIIYNIIYNKKNEKINIKKLIEIINNNEEINKSDYINNNSNKDYNNKKIKEEKNKLKNIIIKKKINNKYLYNNLKVIKIIINKINNYFLLKNKKIKLNSKNTSHNKTICITGPPGVGKTIISINLAKINIFQKNKILIIDSDFLNNSISTILGVKNSASNNILENNIIKLNNSFLDYFNFIKINKKINLLVNNKKINKNNYYILNVFLENINNLKNIYDLIIIDINCNEDLNNIKEIIKISDKCLFISDTNLLEINKSIKILDKFINNINIEINKILENINSLKEIYNLIIIDTNCSKEINYLKNIVEISDECLFITDTNLLEINKSIKLLDIFINKLNIKINKIKIIFNKYNSESISLKLLKIIFSEFNIIGKINYSEIYNKMINKNNKYNLINKKIRKEYLKINYKIIGGNYYGNRKQHFFSK